jgi:hypothetical protein
MHKDPHHFQRASTIYESAEKQIEHRAPNSQRTNQRRQASDKPLQAGIEPT